MDQECNKIRLLQVREVTFVHSQSKMNTVQVYIEIGLLWWYNND